MVTSDERALISVAERAIERATDAQLSRQPRFTQDEDSWMVSLSRWLEASLDKDPPRYVLDSRARDSWLREFWRREPRLAGVLNSVTLIDTNRSWTLAGGRNQVLRYQTVLHDADGAEGWRNFIRRTSLSFWASDLGAVTELGREGRGGPLRAIYHVDSARCRLTGNVETPLRYYPPRGDAQEWRPEDFFRTTSMPSDDETLHGLGWCAVSRCAELARLLYAVMMHDRGELSESASRGLLVLNNVSEANWEDSLSMRELATDSLEARLYGAIQVLTNMGPEPATAMFTALSRLPEGFDIKVFTDLTMYGYALAFGYDPSEFWPVQFGSLGRGTEAEVQHEKATGKGGLDFALNYQEHLQRHLPASLSFEFDQRDDPGQLILAQVRQAKAEVIRTMVEAGGGMIDRDEARQLLVDAELIPPEWTDVVEQEMVDAEEDSANSGAGASRRRAWTEQVMASPRVQRAIAMWPNEPVIAYRWPQDRIETVYDPARRRRMIPAVRRQEVIYQDDDLTITDDDIDRAVQRARRRVGDDLADMLTATTWGE